MVSRKASKSAFIKEVMKNHKKGLSLRAAVKKSKSWNKLSVGYLKSPPVKKTRKKNRKKRTKKKARRRRKKTRKRRR